MAKKTNFTRKKGKTETSDFIYANEMKDDPKFGGKFKGGDIVELNVGNMKVKMTTKKFRPTSKKKLLKDAGKRKLAHRKINTTRTAASLTARKIKPCK